MPAGPASLDAQVDYLPTRWNDGVTNATVLFAEIRARGYLGTAATLRAYLQLLRAATRPTAAPSRPPKVRTITAWLLRHPDRLDPDTASRRFRRVCQTNGVTRSLATIGGLVRVGLRR
jgi:hypothetical protein